MSETQLTTGQLSGITLVSYMSLYRYVRDFPEFFSNTAKQHKRGRRWTLPDLEVVQAIRYLYHERTGKENIRQLLSDGWRPEVNAAYSAETLSRLVEATLAISEEAKRLIKDADKAINEVRIYKGITLDDHSKVTLINQRVDKLEKEIEQIRSNPISEKKRGFFNG